MNSTTLYPTSKIDVTSKHVDPYNLASFTHIHIDWAGVNEMQVIKVALPKTLLDTIYSSGFTQVSKEPTHKMNNYRLITAYLLLRVNLDKLMHAR